MKKKNFVTLLLGVIGGILFAVGMCMCLIAEWDAFTPGIVVAAVGLVVVLVMLIIRRKLSGKPAIRMNGKTLGTLALAVVGALVLGVGMCMVMVWDMMIWGIVVGIVGIGLLLCLIPLCVGLK